MRTLDTNVIVRLLVGDDPRQTPIAEQAYRQVRHGLVERLVRTRGVVVDDIDGVIDALEHWCGARPCLGSGPYCRQRAREWLCLRVPSPISARRDLHWVLGPVWPSPAEARCARPVPATARSGLDAWPCRSAGSAGARGCIGAGGLGPQR